MKTSNDGKDSSLTPRVSLRSMVLPATPPLSTLMSALNDGSQYSPLAPISNAPAGITTLKTSVRAKTTVIHCGLFRLVLESVEGHHRSDQGPVLPDRQQSVIRAGGIIGAAPPPLVAEEVLVEMDGRRGDFLRDAGFSDRRFLCMYGSPSRFSGSPKEGLVRESGLAPPEHGREDDDGGRKTVRRVVSVLPGREDKGKKAPGIAMHEVLLKEATDVTDERQQVHDGANLRR